MKRKEVFSKGDIVSLKYCSRIGDDLKKCYKVFVNKDGNAYLRNCRGKKMYHLLNVASSSFKIVVDIDALFE